MKNLLMKWFDVYSPEKLDDFIIKHLESLKPGSRILDMGCGSQRFKQYCTHLEYYGQDIGDSTDGTGEEKEEMEYGKLNYTGNCWSVEEQDGFFDAILCTEVFEHIPYPEKTHPTGTSWNLRSISLISTQPGH